MPRNFKLTWQPGSGRRPGRWRKKYKRKAYYFSGGHGKSNRQAYETALEEWERLKLRIDASSPKRHQAEYERAIREWESVLSWCRKHPGDDEMSDRALAKLDRLRRHFAAAKPIPVAREDTFAGQFDLSTCPPEFAEVFAALDAASWEPPDMVRQLTGYEKYRAAIREFVDSNADTPDHGIVIDPREFDFDLGFSDPNKEKFKIWRDRLDVMKRSAAPADQTVQAYVERFIEEKKASVAAGQLTAARGFTLRVHLGHFRDWIGSETDVVDITGKQLSGYRLALLEDVQANKWSQTTASDRLNSVKSFVRWLWVIEAIPSLPRIMAEKSKALQISRSSSSIVTFTKQEIATLLREASDRTKLYILLMLNCGMTQKDIADLDVAEVDWESGRVTRKRSKTKDWENVPVVSYPLWPETLRLLRQEYCGGDSGRALLNSKGDPLWYSEVGDDNRLKRNDNVRSAFERLKRKTDIKKPQKSLKKTSASSLRNHPKYAGLEDLFLGHAPRRTSDKHYTQVPRSLFDEAIAWLGTEFAIPATSGDNERT